MPPTADLKNSVSFFLFVYVEQQRLQHFFGPAVKKVARSKSRVALTYFDQNVAPAQQLIIALLAYSSCIRATYQVVVSFECYYYY